MGSLARRKTYLTTIANQGIDPILLDGGDWLFNLGNVKKNKFAARQLLQKGKLLVDAYNQFGYAAAAVGEHDLAFGIDALKALEAQANFPFLCANLFDAEGKALFPGSTVVERNGQKIGVVAALIPLPNHFLKKAGEGLSMTDPIEALRREVKALGDSVDAVFVLAHVDYQDVLKIADTMPGIDFLLEPQSFASSEPTWINDGEEYLARNGRLLLRISGQGSTIGRLDLYLRERGSEWKAVSDDPAWPGNLYNAAQTRLANHIGRHPAMDKLVNEFLRGTHYDGLSEEDVTFVPSKEYLGADTCAGCHVEQTEFWRSTGHGKAYETLEKTGDQFRYDCVSCHVLAYGETFGDAHKVGQYKDVQCESCHGTNPKHPENPAAHKWPKMTDKSCWSCHDPRVTRVPFDPASAFPKVSCPPLNRE